AAPPPAPAKLPARSRGLPPLPFALLVRPGRISSPRWASRAAEERTVSCPFRLPRLLGLLLPAAAAVALAQASRLPELGVNASLNGRRPFPDNTPWNQPVDRTPVDPNSDALVNSIGRQLPLHPDFGTTYEGRPSGIPYIVVPGNTPPAAVTFEYPQESDP